MKLLKLCHSSTSSMPSVQHQSPTANSTGGNDDRSSVKNDGNGNSGGSSSGSSSSSSGSSGGGSLSRVSINMTRQPLLDMLLETRHGNNNSLSLKILINTNPVKTPCGSHANELNEIIINPL